ncbi:MAG: glycosyltransferase [Pirellulaceae bacterium]|nr:glycosyltransferase [Pirellulaceae bacterium]
MPHRNELRCLMSEALEGKHCFFAKREEIDEYGWRNYGDSWADHENLHYQGTKPVISHNNNQYDLLHSMLICYLGSGDVRWWKLAEPLARHIMDIDIYHTDQDKSAYSGGLFWHTAHYQDAATSGHRSYSRKMNGKASPTQGGGPSNEHNYSSGLLLYYYLTGDRRAREAVLELAKWVAVMDDGSQHLLGVVSESPTGAASCTRSPEDHLPGRGVGNSINCLMDGWLVSGDRQHLWKAEELIRRTIHPYDELDSKQFLDVERRWSYTVQLQSLARVWQLTTGVGEFSACREYCRAALLHYADWMTTNEQLYLDKASQLEYPTETWAAQDLRKGNVLLCAAQLATTMKQHNAFRRRGEDLLDRAWQQLMAFPTRNCTRPLGIALQQGYIETTLCHVLHSLNVGGAELLARAFAERCQDTYRVVIACLDALGSMGSEMRAAGFEIVVLDRQPGFDARCVCKLAAFFRLHDVKLVHAHQYAAFFYSSMARILRLRFPIVFTEHGRDYPDYRRAKRVWANKMLLGRCDRVVAVGNCVRTALVQYEGLPWSRVEMSSKAVYRVAANGVNCLYFQPQLGHYEEEDSLIFTGAMNYFPNEQAMAFFCKDVLPRIGTSGVKLRIVGRRPAARVRALHDGQRVLVIGEVDDVRPFVHQSQLFVVPLQQGSGTRLKILEAFAMGKAVVSTSRGAEGIPVTDGKELLLADSPAHFARCVDELLADPNRRRALGRAARDFVVSRFDWSCIQDTVREGYAAIEHR